MPALWYRMYFRAYGLKGIERSIFGFCGIRPIRETLVGLVENKSSSSRKKWLTRLEELGASGA
jgi:hypothetical protein